MYLSRQMPTIIHNIVDVAINTTHGISLPANGWRRSSSMSTPGPRHSWDIFSTEIRPWNIWGLVDWSWYMSQPYFCGSVINLDWISYIAFWLIEVLVKFWDCHLLIFFVICLQHAAAKSPRHVANLQRCLVKLADNAAFIGLQPNPKRHGDPGESWDRLSTSKGQEN